MAKKLTEREQELNRAANIVYDAYKVLNNKNDLKYIKDICQKYNLDQGEEKDLESLVFSVRQLLAKLYNKFVPDEDKLPDSWS